MRAGAVVLAGALAVGCASPNGELEPAEGEASAVAGVAATLEVKVARDVVDLVLHVTNASEAPLQFVFPTSQRYDFMIDAEDGTRVWQWSADRAFLQVVSEVTLAPRETWEFQERWDPGDRSGRFRAVGVVRSAEGEIRQTAAFELP